MNSENPYLRLRSYTETDAQYFKGRETESGEIFDLLRRNDVVVLYSESAEGKSSILAAGLYPRLRRHNFLPVSIVFTEDEFAEKSPDFDTIILGRIRQAMAEANPGAREPMAPDFARKVNESECFEWVSTSDVEMPQDSENAAALTGSAWWMLRDFAIERYGVRVCPVLVFDQFEEVFTRAASAWTDAFFGWLERLFSDNVPEAVGKALDAFPEDEEPEFSTRKDFRTIVSMRNEYMGELDYWGVQRHFLPEFKNSRYCLRALTLDEAEEVLDLRFADRPELKKSVLAALSGVPASKLAEAQRDLPMVPAMLLSVVCGVLCEEKSAQKYLDNLKDGNSAAVDNILWDFYRTSMRECRIGPTMRKYIEDVLVDKGGKRVRTKVDSKALRRIGFRDKILPQLKKKGLVKTSRINGEDYVELVHDRLAAIIEKSRTRRSSSKQRLAMMFIVILTCLIMLFLGTRQQLYSDTLENHPFAELNNRENREIDIVVDFEHNSLVNNSDVRKANIKVQNHLSQIYIEDCQNLNEINLLKDIGAEIITVFISRCPNLHSVNLKGFFLNVEILTDESFVLKLNPSLQHLEIHGEVFSDNHNIIVIPSPEKTSSNIENFEIINGILFNNREKGINYIKGELSDYNNIYVPFPESFRNLESLKYDSITINKTYFNQGEDFRLKFNRDSTILSRNLTPTFSGHADLSHFQNLNYILGFENCNISSITFPINLKHIAYNAFQNCHNLRNIEFPDNLEVINLDAFSNCINLKKLRINSHTRIFAGSLPNLQISDIEISEAPGIGIDSLHLCRGAVLNIDEEPVLLTTSFSPNAEFAEKIGYKFIAGKLFAPIYSDSTSFFNISSISDIETEYMARFDDLFYIPISESGNLTIYDSIGNSKRKESPKTLITYNHIVYNNILNRDTIIYVNPSISQADIKFAVCPDSIKIIHLPFGEPYYSLSDFSKLTRRIIMTEEQMMNTVLYVPYGCADNYNIPEYKWFKEIREDPWIERYLAPLRANLKSIPWWIVYTAIFGSFLLILLINYFIYRKRSDSCIRQIFKKSLFSWVYFIIWFIIPFIAAYYLAISYGWAQEKAISAGATAAIVTTSFIIFSPQIIRFVSRIFNRYVIDPLALLFH